jgi:hypothetical protein
MTAVRDSGSYTSMPWRAPGDDVLGIHGAAGTADDAVFAGRLERHGLDRQREPCRLRDQRSVRESPPVRVQGVTGPGPDFVERDSPGCGRGLAHEPAPLGADLAQLRPAVRDAGAAARALGPESPARLLAAEIDQQRHLLDRDLRPVGVQLLGEDHGQGCLDALPDLRARRADDDPVVRLDADQHAERVLGRSRRRILGGCEPGREHQGAGGRQRRLQEDAARDDRGPCAHFDAFSSSAARAMARRMRT